MGKKSKSGSPFPEMDNILAGMEDLLRDEDGNALTPDHPQYKKLATLMETMVNNIQEENNEGLSDPGEPHGHA